MRKIEDYDTEELENDLNRLAEIQSDKEFISFTEQQTIKKFVEKARLTMNWELMESNSLQMISDALSSSDIGNVVIVSHGKQSGHLVDSDSNELPSSAFTNIAPNIQSINFYSCHSQNIEEIYNLEDKLGSGPSFYKLRYVTTVRTNEFMDAEYFAPVAAFKHYITQLDKYLSNSTKGAILMQGQFGHELADYEAERICKVDISEVDVEHGGYAISLNGKYVGSFDQNNNVSELNFPCSYLSNEKNKLKIGNIKNGGKSVIRNLGSFNISVAGKLLTPEDSPIVRMNSMILYKF